MSTPGTLFWFHQQRAKAKESARPSKKPKAKGKGRSREAVLARPESCRSADFWIGAISETMNEEELTNALTELAGSDASLPELCSFAGDVLGKDAGRIQAKTLDLVARYVSSKFDDAEEAQVWLSRRDLRLAVWTSYECVWWAFGKLPKRTDNITDERAIKFAKKLLEAVGSWLRREAENGDVIKALTMASNLEMNEFYDTGEMSGFVHDLLGAAADLGKSQEWSAFHSCSPQEGLTAMTVDLAARVPASMAHGYASEEWHFWREKNLRVLVGVIAEAIRAYPG